ncbi:hypothetical protein [Aureibacter tunicatorum]|uniref:Auto-transporter adhesin head GIN domain-containing protein n=1 Tax=Aureibacter tunicatorum TaxID=866807 RepID=A0AAE4BQG3_9BACT|nr:hypothetical protein [Aureibacter tunicatorum]MDR6239079.1 hypothetical protein [Aureibacter tunicatorum]BDD04995.1 hypothetical protein AUTU_24780 [Aureibacter tunicatorum]
MRFNILLTLFLSIFFLASCDQIDSIFNGEDDDDASNKLEIQNVSFKLAPITDETVSIEAFERNSQSYVFLIDNGSDTIATDSITVVGKFKFDISSTDSLSFPCEQMIISFQKKESVDLLEMNEDMIYSYTDLEIAQKSLFESYDDITIQYNHCELFSRFSTHDDASAFQLTNIEYSPNELGEISLKLEGYFEGISRTHGDASSPAGEPLFHIREGYMNIELKEL